MGWSLMPWFKVDDTLHSHPKARGASLTAMGLWALCGSYSMSYKLDGFVPGWFAHSFPNGKKLAGELVRVGLWLNAVRDGEDGYQFHDWTDYQPTADEIEAEREAARQRQRASRERRRNGKTGRFGGAAVTAYVTRDMRRDSRVTCGVSHATPTRPDPTRPINTRGETSHHVVALGDARGRDGMMRLRQIEVAA